MAKVDPIERAVGRLEVQAFKDGTIQRLVDEMEASVVERRDEFFKAHEVLGKEIAPGEAYARSTQIVLSIELARVRIRLAVMSRFVHAAYRNLSEESHRTALKEIKSLRLSDIDLELA